MTMAERRGSTGTLGILVSIAPGSFPRVFLNTSADRRGLLSNAIAHGNFTRHSMHCLLLRRVQLTAKQVAHGAKKVATNGAQVGYKSEVVFSRAFKQANGQSSVR
jgi:AraC-like DNA-binding protein